MASRFPTRANANSTMVPMCRYCLSGSWKRTDRAGGVKTQREGEDSAVGREVRAQRQGRVRTQWEEGVRTQWEEGVRTQQE